MSKFYKFLITILIAKCLIFINGCGQTGDLYLPEEAKTISNQYESRT